PKPSGGSPKPSGGSPKPSGGSPKRDLTSPVRESQYVESRGKAYKVAVGSPQRYAAKPRSHSQNRPQTPPLGPWDGYKARVLRGTPIRYPEVLYLLAKETPAVSIGTD
ncbi:hypothetical protein EIP91_012271, partial [Steccherinum ochraceum]